MIASNPAVIETELFNELLLYNLQTHSQWYEV
jgi:hypothetical protein